MKILRRKGPSGTPSRHAMRQALPKCWAKVRNLKRPLPPSLITSRCVQVIACPTPNDDAIKFTLDQPGRLLPPSMPSLVLTKAPPHHEVPIPLLPLKGLLDMTGVEEVLVACDFITVRKGPQVDWKLLQGGIEQALHSLPMPYPPHHHNHDDDEASSNVPAPPDRVGIEREIQDLLEEKVRPYVMADGGDVRFIKFDPETGVVYLQMIGACSSCSSSTITLRIMIRNVLVHYFEEIVRDVKPYEELEQDRDLVQHDYDSKP